MTDPVAQVVSPLAELDAMRAVATALEPLEPNSRGRVLEWALKAYAIGLPVASHAISHAIVDARPTSLGGTSLQLASTNYSDLATLFSEANPETDAEKALVAGYFFCHVKGVEEFDSFTLNSELTHLGHRVSNITRALTALIESRPALAVQTRKEGKTQQARKKFKITMEGRKRVDQMIAGFGRED